MSALLRRKLASLVNTLRVMTAWEKLRSAAFLSVGFWMLYGLYAAFYRLLEFLSTVELIGPLLIWKLTAMTLMTTFSMVAISSLIISLTTFFYAYDLAFLFKAPVPVRRIFLDKSLEAAFFSSWMIALVLAPFVIALKQVFGLGAGFYAASLLLAPPFMLLASTIGMAFTMLIMRLFPSPRTRDAIWILSSLSVALVYVLLRFSQPEKLIRPDALALVADYLNYLQAPTTPYLPSWWVTKALEAAAAGKSELFLRQAALLYAAAAAAYGGLVVLAGRIYLAAYSGAQEGARLGFSQDVRPISGAGWFRAPLPALLFKDFKMFFRDVKHWSQIVLIFALMCVYLFSIQRLPLDTPDLQSLVSFLNLGIAGFVVASLGLRFTFPSISLENRSFWVVRSAPLSTVELMKEKLLFSLLPMSALGTALIAASNYLLDAAPFISGLSLVSMLVMTLSLTTMGIGFGAMFPRFNVANIHQIESSAGGFLYMCACLAYIALMVAILAWPVQAYFMGRLGRPEPQFWLGEGLCIAALIVLNWAACAVPWMLGRRNLERYEAD